MGKDQSEGPRRQVGNHRGEGRKDARGAVGKILRSQTQEEPATPGTLAEYAAQHRAAHNGTCAFCALGPAAAKDLDEIMEKNASGEWSMTLSAAWRWFRNEYSYRPTAEAMRNHVRRHVGREWTDR